MFKYLLLLSYMSIELGDHMANRNKTYI